MVQSRALAREIGEVYVQDVNWYVLQKKCKEEEDMF